MEESAGKGEDVDRERTRQLTPVFRPRSGSVGYTREIECTTNELVPRVSTVFNRKSHGSQGYEHHRKTEPKIDCNPASPDTR